MTWWQTLLVAAVPAIIAPVFLALQQRRQFDHDETLRTHEADRAERRRRTDQRRDAYVAVIRAVTRYRVDIAQRLAEAEAKRSPGASMTGVFIRSAAEQEFASKRHLEALQAIAVARLWASDDVLERVSALEGALLRFEVEAMTPSPLPLVTGSERLKGWTELTAALGMFASAAHTDVTE